MTRLSRSLLAGVLPLTLMLAGCNHTCGLNVCLDGLVITFDSSFKGPGAYDISVVDVPLMFGPVARTRHVRAGTGSSRTPGRGGGGGCAAPPNFVIRELNNIEMIHGFQPKEIQITQFAQEGVRGGLRRRSR